MGERANTMHRDAGTTRRDARPVRLACVAYLNAKPLIAPLEGRQDVEVVYDVPSRLKARLVAGEADAALLPVFDLLDPADGLRMLTAGGIGCDGPTLTVRLFSRVPIAAVRRVALDTDSHTSVALLKVLLHERGVTARYAPLDRSTPIDAFDADAILLIGDKVVTDKPDAAAFPHGLDLGESWREATSLPFVFAAWAVREGCDATGLQAMLSDARARGVADAPALAERYAPGHGWPLDLAKRYLGEVLRYDLGPRQLAAIRRYASACAALGLTPTGARLTLAAGSEPRGAGPIVASPAPASP